MKQITAIIRTEKLEAVQEALKNIDCHGITVTEVKGRGEQLGIEEKYRGKSYKIDLLPKVEIFTVVHDSAVDEVVNTIIESAKTGNIGDGKIFISNVDEVIKIRTGERGDNVL
ncbi:MAG: transcriptional regulator [Methanosphaera sp. rholeuAM270]|nr:MAG: transcriptional regulator [Methanosphaera sp. rholeuAM270]